jgi:hypothetical protein
MHEKFKKAYLKLKNKNDAQRHSESNRMETSSRLHSRANSPPRQQTSGGSNVQLISQQQQQQQ